MPLIETGSWSQKENEMTVLLSNLDWKAQKLRVNFTQNA
jgi:hypothetical protein